MHFLREGEVHILQLLPAPASSQSASTEDDAAVLEPVLIATARKPAVVGTASLIDQHTTSIVTIKASIMCEVAHLSCLAFNQLAADFPELVECVRLASDAGRAAVTEASSRADDEWDCFLSHNWGPDGLGRDNHQRVMRLCSELCKRGVRCWFDGTNMSGDVNQAMSEGISKSRYCLTLITTDYMTKVEGRGPHGDDDSCKFEFDLACLKRGTRFMLPVVMEPVCLNTRSWSPKVGGKLGMKLYVDCSNDSPDQLEAAVAKLVEQMGLEHRSPVKMGRRMTSVRKAGKIASAFVVTKATEATDGSSTSTGTQRRRTLQSVLAQVTKERRRSTVQSSNGTSLFVDPFVEPAQAQAPPAAAEPPFSPEPERI